MRVLVQHGADINDINPQMRAQRLGIGYEQEPQVSKEDYLAGKFRQFGQHNAGEFMHIIGNLGYPETRQPGFTPVYRLNTTSFAIDRTYAKLAQQGALPQAVRLYGKAAQRRWDGFA